MRAQNIISQAINVLVKSGFLHVAIFEDQIMYFEYQIPVSTYHIPDNNNNNFSLAFPVACPAGAMDFWKLNEEGNRTKITSILQDLPGYQIFAFAWVCQNA